MKSLLKKCLLSLTVFLMVAGISSCSNGAGGENLENVTKDNYSFEITLPGNAARAVNYYGQNDAAKYVVTVSKDSVQVAQKEGLPGATVKFTVAEEGTYSINVKAYNSENVLIGEGDSSITVSVEPYDKNVKVTINPKVKDFEIDVDVEWGDGEQIPEGFVKVAGGTVTGAAYTDNDEGVFPAGRNVTLGSFYMGKYEVTQAQYKSVMAGQKVTVEGTEYTLADSPSYCNGINEDYKVDFGKDHANHPVENVNWFDAVYYCNALSAKENLEPCYTITVTIVSRGHIIGATVEYDKAKNGYRLPTEAEWEYAARGGDPTKADWNYTYSGANKAEGTSYIDSKNTGLDSVGWYSYNNITGITGDSVVTNSADGCGTHEVGQKDANALGIYDMSGNVYEWCYDLYGSITADTDPAGAASGNYSVFRGGGWDDYACYLSVSARRSRYSNLGCDSIGFRVCRSSSN